MEQGGSRFRRGLAGMALAVFAIAVWFALDESDVDPTAAPPELSTPQHTLASPTATQRLSTADHRIAENGRLTLDASALPSDRALSLALEMPDEARGAEPRPVRVVSVDGREIETTAHPSPGSGSGVEVDIDPVWLSPGRYLIEVKTAERTPLPLRRFVLEVQ